MKPIMQAVVFCVGAVAGAGLTLAAQQWLPERRAEVVAPLEPLTTWYDANPRQAAVWDGTCPIEFRPTGGRQFKNDDTFEGPRNEHGDYIGFYHVLTAAAEMGNREAMKCLLVFHWFDPYEEPPLVFYEYLWLAHDYGLTAPYEWWLETDQYLTQDQMWVMRDSARGKFRQASKYFAVSRSKNADPPAPEADTVTADVMRADADAFFEDVAAEIFRLEEVRPKLDE